MKTQIINITQKNQIKIIMTNEKGKKFVGVATCLPEDDFDYNFGVSLAYAKATTKFDKFVEKQKFQEILELEQLQSQIKKKLEKTIEEFENLQVRKYENLDYLENLKDVS